MLETALLDRIEATTSAANLFYGKIDPKTNIRNTDPIVTLQRLPSVSFDWVSRNSITSFQISIRSKSISTARSLAEEIHDSLNGHTGTFQSHAYVVRFESDGGEIYEEDGDIVHIPLTYAVRHVR